MVHNCLDPHIDIPPDEPDMGWSDVVNAEAIRKCLEWAERFDRNRSSHSLTSSKYGPEYKMPEQVVVGLVII